MRFDTLLQTRILYGLGGLYTLAAGAAFALMPLWIYQQQAITPPNHPAYVQFPAVLLLIFGLMCLRSAWDPFRFREQILYVVAAKAGFVLVVGLHVLTGGLPMMWIVLAGIEFAFGVLLFIGWQETAPEANARPPGG